MTQTLAFRFAPSPNGLLHLGHAYSALLNARMAATRDAHLYLRIEDIDTTRSKPELIKAIMEDMAWLEIEFDPNIRHQSDHFAQYRKTGQRLIEQGLLYRCFCTRTEIAKNALEKKDPDGAPVYARTCAQLSQHEIAQRQAKNIPFSWRLDNERARGITGPLSWQEMEGTDGETCSLVPANITSWGDVVLIRKDTPTSYHLSVALCDAAQNISHIVRGKDLYHATSIHRTLQVLQDLPEPKYFHHRLIRDSATKKLAKSTGSMSLRSLRARGWTRDDALDYLELG